MNRKRFPASLRGRLALPATIIERLPRLLDTGPSTPRLRFRHRGSGIRTSPGAINSVTSVPSEKEKADSLWIHTILRDRQYSCELIEGRANAEPNRPWTHQVVEVPTWMEAEIVGGG
ncbi:MAG TPA: hypothetical protein VJL86_13700, partial [Steroidobacteraceae bacterium]|nr:hypothetical protein [Steroidobacteraceae bacterium]